MLAIDISNYTDPLTVAALDAWKEAGIGHVIVQAVSPPPGYPVGRTPAQIQICLNQGFTVDAYIWLWFDLDISDITRKLGLIAGLNIRQLWLDVEDTAASKYDQATCEAKVNAALAECDAIGINEPTGVYTGRWFWQDPRYMGNTTAFSDRELWDANYDDVADAALGFVPYGGWTSSAIKQFRGTTSVGGIGGVDLNVLSVAEEGELHPDFPGVPPNPIPPDPPDSPDSPDCATYRSVIERGVNRLQIELDRKTAAGKTATLRRTLIKEIQAELFGALSS